MSKLQLKTVSAIAVVDLAHELILRNFLSVEVLRQMGMDVFTQYRLYQQGESIAENRLAEHHLVALWDRVDAKSDFAFMVGRTVNAKAKGLLANWISYSDTLEQAFHIFQRNVGLLNYAKCWRLFEDTNHNEVALVFEFDSALSYPNLAIERSMVAIIAWANHFVSEPLEVKSASFTYPEPHHRDQYTTLFGEHLTFSADENRIVLALSNFQQVLDSSNPYLRDVLKMRARTVSLLIDGDSNTTSQVQTFLIHDLAKYSNIETLLTDMHMSRATLYRKLKHEGATFSELVKQARQQLLSSQRQTELSNDERAALLGFNDVSSYYRFIKHLGLHG